MRIDGQVMKRNFCQRVAPSTEAASYCSAGIASRPAIRISVQNGSDFQMCISIEKRQRQRRVVEPVRPVDAPVRWKMGC